MDTVFTAHSGTGKRGWNDREYLATLMKREVKYIQVVKRDTMFYLDIRGSLTDVCL